MPLKSCDRMRQQLGALAFATVAIWACASQGVCQDEGYAAAVLADQPVAFFRFSGSENSPFVDAAEKTLLQQVGRDGVQLGVEGPLAVGVDNTAAHFDGAAQFTVVAEPDVFDLTGAMSIEFWMRPTAGGEGTQCILAKGDYLTTGAPFYVVYFQTPQDDGGYIRFGVAGGFIDKAARIPENEFTHVVVTYDPSLAGENACIYLNGKQSVTTHVAGATKSVPGGPLQVGGLRWEPEKQPYIQFFAGDLDELAIYPHALQAGRVNAHFEHAAVPPHFESEVQPILARACLECHAEEPAGNLDLRTVSSMLRGGTNGPAITRNSSAQSLLVEMIDFDEMPPPDSGHAISSAERRLIGLWIDRGCVADEAIVEPPAVSWVSDQDRAHWAFRQLKAGVEVPTVEHASSVRSPLDAFIQSRLELQGLSLAEEVDRWRLARRLAVDLTGVPPVVERVDRFTQDARPDAVERLVDEYLASPQFGIRWGRHWLDVAGYTDTISFDDDFGAPIGFRSGKWRYRDYVIRSFNQDKSFARFVTEQLAGDELVSWKNAPTYTPEMIEALVATGFLRCCEDISLEDPRPFIIWSVLHDSVEQIGTSLLGLTVNCSRCHSHKFEPIPQRDYYRLMAVLTPALNPANWKNPQERALPDVAPPVLQEINAHNAAIDGRVKVQNELIAAIRQAHENKLREAKYVNVNEPDRAATKAAFETDPSQRDEVQKALLEKYKAELAVSAEAIEAALSADEQQKIAEAQKTIGQQNALRRTHDWIQAVYDVGAVPLTRIFRRGDYLHPRRAVPPGGLEVLAERDFNSYLELAQPPQGSGHRLALAEWLTDEQERPSALLARVAVNRIWGHLLGQGIVTTPENLGPSGAEPTHPDLLEWLSVAFRQTWSTKDVVRRIVASSVYRQTSVVDTAQAEESTHADPANRLLWKSRLRRVEAEVVRDAILQTADALNLTMGGPPVPLAYNPDGSVLVASNLPQPSAAWRRTVFLLNRRIYNPSFLMSFDKPTVTGSICERTSSAVVAQSLSMLNDDFAIEMARLMAARVMAECGPSADERIIRLYRLVLSRLPSASELAACREMLLAQAKLYENASAESEQETDAPSEALVDLTQTLLSTSEFLYLE